MVNRMPLLLIRVLFMLIVPCQSMAAVDVRVDRDPVAIDESFQITFSSSEAIDGAPDFGPLEKDFEILAQNQSNNIQVVNGRVTRSQIWVIEVMPKRTGTLTLPPIRFGAQSTEAQPITVKQLADLPDQKPQDDVFIEVEVSPQTPYVQAEINYTLRVFRAVNLYNATLSEPNVESAEVILQRLGNDKRYDTHRNGRRYEVIERRYAIFAQRSGPVTISPIRFEAKLGSGSRFFSDPFDATKSIRRHSKAVTLEVQPIPPAYSEDLWLPARRLELNEVWSEDPPQFKVGEPVTRTMAIIANGLLAEQLPELQLDLPEGFKQYPDQPVLENRPSDQGIAGVRQEKIAIIPSQAGDYTLPAMDIAWWNIDTDRIEHARLPERRVTVLAATDAQETGPAPTTLGPDAEPLAVPVETIDAPIIQSDRIWKWSAIILALGWIMTVVAWWRSRRRASKGRQPASTKPTIGPALKALDQACKKGDAQAAKHALLEWSAARRPDNPATSLRELADRTVEPLKSEIDKLNAHLYSQDQAAWQDGRCLWNDFKQAHNTHGQKPSTKTYELEPLYKT